MRILIVGMGNVGLRLSDELFILDPVCYDKRYEWYDKPRDGFDIAFICVDTPLVDGRLDDTEVRNAIRDNEAKTYVIKSTVMPGTTESIIEDTGKAVVFSPEYYGTTQHSPESIDFTVLGGNRYDCVKVQQVLQEVHDASHRFVITDPRTAELAKLMENCWIATKVSFCNQFLDLANANQVCYEELREIFVMDPRVNPSHSYVYRTQPYWDSHCLNKDVPATAALGAPLIGAVVRYNEERKSRANI